MIETSNDYLLMIEPIRATSNPINDELTELAKKVLSLSKWKRAFRGFHRCSCGKNSDNKEHILPDGRITNSLIVHYISEHRQEVPEDEIRKLLEYQ